MSTVNQLSTIKVENQEISNPRFARPIAASRYVPPQEFRVLKADGSIDADATSPKILACLDEFGQNLFADLHINAGNWTDLNENYPDLARAVQSRALEIGNEIIRENDSAKDATGLSEHALNLNVIKFLEPMLVYRQGDQTYTIPRGDIFYSPQDSSYAFQRKPSSAQGLYDSAMANLEHAVTGNGSLCYGVDRSSVKNASLPIADAGADQIVTEGSSLQLHAENSVGENLTYVWEQIDSSVQVEWQDRFSPTPTLKVPKIFDSNVVLNLRLTVIDESGEQSTDTVAINVLDVPKPLPLSDPIKLLIDPKLLDDLLNNPLLAPKQQNS